MNKVYKVIWNSRLSCWQAVSELAKGHSSSSQTNSVKSRSTLAYVVSAALLFSVAILPLSVQAAIQNNALPTGAQVNSGSASFTQTNDTLNINQNSQTLSSNWNTFNIGQDATVNFNQPNQSSVAINHVLDSNASQIMGRLNANGQVFLLNPNGVVFSKTAQVNVGGIVASTLQLSDSDIQTGKYLLKGDASSNASIENHGSINTLSGGTVALIAPTVINTGSIKTPNGTTHLTAASQVTLALQDGSLTQYQVDEGVLQGLVDNGGAIVANNGAVYLSAKAKDSLSKAVVNHSGIIEANRLVQNAKGEIILLGDMQQGEVVVSGTLTAEGKNGQDGGFIETSAARVKIEQGTKVSTLSDTAQTGTWLIDPTDFTISAGNTSQTTSGMGASTLQNNLSNNNVTLQTVSNGADEGNINVDAAVNWSAATALTLDAHNDININADVTATNDNGKLNLIYGQNTANTNADYHLNNSAKINLKAGQNFSTKKGSNAAKTYQVITSLGSAGSTTGTDLQGIDGNLSGNYVLGSDIDATATAGWNSGEGFNPIGYYDTNKSFLDLDQETFNGKFDGLGHSINNLKIASLYQGIGLFAITSDTALIQNIGLGNIVYSGYATTGGLVGLNRGTINNAHVSSGTVTGNNSKYGGLVGWNTNSGKISNSYANATVKGLYSSHDDMGGLVGYNDGLVESSFATGSVSGNNYIGGLVGGTSGIIRNSYATGTVKGTNSVGGLVGFNGGAVDQSYSSGEVSGNTFIGGLIGNNEYGTAKSSFWNTDTSGISTSAGGTAKTTAELKQLSTFEGWDIDTAGATGKVWRIYEDQSAPLLRRFLKPVVSEVSTDFSDKVYDGLITSGALVSPTFSYKTISKNAGVYSLVDGSIIVMGDPAADNMTQFGKDIIYKAVSGPSSFTVTKKSLDITDIKATSKVYDGTTIANLDSSSAILVGKINGDTVTLPITVSGSFSDKNVGIDKTVSVSATALSGADAGNYSLSQTTGLTASITPKGVTVSNITANDKTYDGSTAATINTTGATLAGIIAGDNLSATAANGSFSDKNAGADKTVSITGISLGGSDAGNYTLANNTASSTASISKAAISGVSGITANDKTYDGSTAATINTTGATLAGIIAGDNLSATAANGSFSDKNAGADKTVSITGISLGGSDAGNYTLANNTASSTASISKAASTVTANSGSTTYNGQSQSVNGFSATGLVNGETESVLDQVSAGATGTNAGSYVSTASGSDNNYDLTFVNGSLDIAKAQIKQVSGITADNRIFDTSTNATLNTQSAQFDGIFGTDELTVGSATGQFENSLVGVDKTVNITGISLSGAAAANYDLLNTTATTRADIYAPTPIASAQPTAAYLQALPTRQVQARPIAANLTIAAIDVINGGVNLTGLTTLTGVR
ncbi:filamentous hemagglutinin N-terminal domain-containing protein [Psychrobacter sp. NG25]|uniref:YDG domain-containing protein n=1 Tax=Psychrobacter sp. NG25 TaxID=2782005 RepID=UPI0018834624|nr:YDG domain-containing protein [Psychrobacter sp. NG25]MBF0657751.1 filamentous hemagglutinin N-terminal domain-containing protein [Psychrobacter sp. NG25]